MSKESMSLFLLILLIVAGFLSWAFKDGDVEPRKSFEEEENEKDAENIDKFLYIETLEDVVREKLENESEYTAIIKDKWILLASQKEGIVSIELLDSQSREVYLRSVDFNVISLTDSITANEIKEINDVVLRGAII